MSSSAKWKNLLLCVFLVLAVVIGAIGCGASKSPSQVVTEFFQLMSQEKYEAASKYVSSEAKPLFAFFTSLAEGLKQFASEEFGSRAIRRVEILSERINGNQAEVHYIFHYTDGSQDPEGSDILVKEKGRWKIGLSF